MEGHVFKNWAQTYSCQPELYFEPQNQQDLRQVRACIHAAFSSSVVNKVRRYTVNVRLNKAKVSE